MFVWMRGERGRRLRRLHHTRWFAGVWSQRRRETAPPLGFSNNSRRVRSFRGVKTLVLCVRGDADLTGCCFIKWMIKMTLVKWKLLTDYSPCASLSSFFSSARRRIDLRSRTLEVGIFPPNNVSQENYTFKKVFISSADTHTHTRWVYLLTENDAWNIFNIRYFHTSLFQTADWTMHLTRS